MYCFLTRYIFNGLFIAVKGQLTAADERFSYWDKNRKPIGYFFSFSQTNELLSFFLSLRVVLLFLSRFRCVCVCVCVLCFYNEVRLGQVAPADECGE